ncbi:hypothetical protein [Nocardia sp. CA-120079]|uniref:hypothetical protein n=1 Tax=Nocardia sp. CA-120079 TaxID=3239974 RepID=UPI003D996DBE
MTVNDSRAWQPFSSRNAGQPFDLGWHEGVPQSLEHSLREWLDHQFLLDRGVRQRVAARLRYVPSDQCWYHDMRGVPTEALLDWVDATLHVWTGDMGSHSGRSIREQVNLVDDVLRDGRSVWMVSEKRDSLERRQDPTVTAAVRQAGESAVAANRNAAATHLQVAWDAAYRLHPDPSTAYREAILAVEAAAIPVVVPTQAGATLGHVLGQLRNQGHLYALAILDKSGISIPVTAVVLMIGLLWEGHTDRHEGVKPAPPITPEAAQMAATLAVALVQLFTTGAIQRRP